MKLTTARSHALHLVEAEGDGRVLRNQTRRSAIEKPRPTGVVESSGVPGSLSLLRTACRVCGRPVTVVFRPTEGRPVAVVVPCPHRGCRPMARTRIMLRGDLITWWAGHGDDPTL